MKTGVPPSKFKKKNITESKKVLWRNDERVPVCGCNVRKRNLIKKMQLKK